MAGPRFGSPGLDDYRLRTGCVFVLGSDLRRDPARIGTACREFIRLLESTLLHLINTSTYTEDI